MKGVIPKGNYGAGPVEVWDSGVYEMEGDLAAADQLARGELKFKLHGRKLRGSFALVHTGKRAQDPKDRKNWLLIKHARRLCGCQLGHREAGLVRAHGPHDEGD